MRMRGGLVWEETRDAGAAVELLVDEFQEVVGVHTFLVFEGQDEYEVSVSPDWSGVFRDVFAV